MRRLARSNLSIILKYISKYTISSYRYNTIKQVPTPIWTLKPQIFIPIRIARLLAPAVKTAGCAVLAVLPTDADADFVVVYPTAFDITDAPFVASERGLDG